MTRKRTCLVLVVLAACGTMAPMAPVNQAVGAAGGDVKASDGSGVSIPPGALTGNTQISMVSAPDAPPPPAAMPVGMPVTFGPEGQRFNVPVTVTLAFDAGLLPAGKTVADLAIYTAPKGTTAYTRLQTTKVDATHLAAQVSHFSTFVVAVQTACVVSCGNFSSVCTGGGAGTGGAGAGSGMDGGTTCTQMSGCLCQAYCNTDGTPAMGGACNGSAGAPSSGGGSGGVPNLGPTDGGVSCTPSTGNSYSVQCTTSGCVCMLNGTAMMTLAAVDCTADLSTVVMRYTACGFPGVYVPVIPPPDGGTTSGGSSGTPSSGGGGGGAGSSGSGGGTGSTP